MARRTKASGGAGAPVREPKTVLFWPVEPLDESKEMQPEASIKINVFEREVCDRCHHFHRKAILFAGSLLRPRRNQCPCCRQDIQPSKITEIDDE